MRPVSCRGTLGDTFICMVKMYGKRQRYVVNHHTIHRYLLPQIEEIYYLIGNIELRFVRKPRIDLEEITSDVHEQDPEFFPMFDIYRKYFFKKPYHVIQPHSGKPVGFNNKVLPVHWVEDVVLTLQARGERCVLVGTDAKYAHISGCINLIGRTTIRDVMSIITYADQFTGVEGLFAFFALSQKKPSFVFYAEEAAVKRRIIDSPWEDYVTLSHISEYNDYLDDKDSLILQDIRD